MPLPQAPNKAYPNLKAAGWNKGIYGAKRKKYELGLPISCERHGEHTEWRRGANSRNVICKLCAKENSDKYKYDHPFEKFVTYAKNRSHECNIDAQYVAQIYLDQKGYCAISGLPLDENVMSLDRIDSDLGYLVGNIQWVHKDINRMKSNFNQQYFIEMCNKISLFNNKN